MLDAQSAGALGDVLSRQAAEEFRNANIGRDQQAANRGLLSSSVNEIARAGDSAAGGCAGKSAAGRAVGV